MEAKVCHGYQLDVEKTDLVYAKMHEEIDKRHET